MTVLDTFFFMFEADTTAMKKGVTEADTLTKKLEKSLEETDKTTQKLGKNFLDMAINAGKAAAGLLALGVIKQTIANTADHTNAVAMQARALGTSTEALSLWQGAVVRAGGSAEEATATISGLVDKLRTMSVTGGQSFAALQLGLSQKDLEDPTKALLKLSETFGKLNNQQQLFLGQRLGLDVATVTLISKGRTELEAYLKRQQELGVVTKEQARVAALYKQQVAELGTVYETVRRELTSDFLPALTWLLAKVENVILFFRDHKEFAIGFFGAIAAILTALYIPTVIRAAVATWALIGPYVAIGLAIAALSALFALIAEDVWKFMHGQDSMIGELSKKWPALGEIVKFVCNLIVAAIKAIPGTIDDLLVILKAAFDYLASLLQFVVEIFTMGPQKALERFNDRVGEIFKGLKDKFKVFGDASAEIMKMITDPVKTFSDAWQDATDNVEKLFEIIKTGPKGIIEWLGKKLGVDLSATYGDAANSPQVASGGGKPVGKGDAANGRQIADKLVAMGWSREQAAGIAGSFVQESTGKADARNPTSGAYGLGQWLGSRKKDFEQYSGKSLEGSSIDEQLQFFQFEVTKGKEKRAGNMLRAATTAADAARIHSQYYERPGAAEANIARRQALASDILAGQTQVAQTNTPLSTMTSAAISNANTTNNRSLSVKTGPISVNTAATDGRGTADALGSSLRDHLQSTIDHFDDGVAA